MKSRSKRKYTRKTKPAPELNRTEIAEAILSEAMNVMDEVNAKLIAGTSSVSLVKGEKRKLPLPNSLNLYPKELGGIKFEYIEKPIGPLYQSLNDGRWYQVHIWNMAKGQLESLVFPDQEYYNPKEFAQVIGAEPWRRFFERHFSLLEKISPWLFIGAMGIMLLALLIFAGGK